MSKRRSLTSRYATRLHRALEIKGVTLEELQYISKEDFSTWMRIGDGTIDYADKKLAELGLTWGDYTYKYYSENKELINPCSSDIVKADINEIALENLRKDVIKDVLKAVIREEKVSYNETIISSQCRVAVKYANTLIGLLKKDT